MRSGKDNIIVLTWLLGLWLLMSSAAAISEPRLSLTAEEQQWLNSVDEIRLCSDPDWMPYEGINEQGQHTGIMSDFHLLWSQMLDKPVVLQVTESWQQSLRFMQDKKCDVLSSAQELPSRRHYLRVTEPFIDYPFAVATQPDQPFIINLSPLMTEQFAMVRGYAAVDIIRQRYPEIQLTLVDSAQQGLKLVETGKLYGFIDTVPSINYQTLKHGISHITISGVLEDQYQMAVGIHKDLPQLLSIYNKAIDATQAVEQQRILNNWLSLSFEYQFNYTLMWQILAGVIALLGLFFYHYYTVNRHNRELQQVNRQLQHISHSDHLTGLPNRYYLHQAFETELSRYQRYQHGFSLLIIDIDHFKTVNDHFGHVVGDEIIRQMAGLFSEHIRDNDVVGRWGGEEFLILCPDTNLQGARTLAEHLRERIAQTHFGIDNMTVTASFGVTDYRDGEMIKDCIRRADQALYQAKHNGRNQTVVF